MDPVSVAIAVGTSSMFKDLVGSVAEKFAKSLLDRLLQTNADVPVVVGEGRSLRLQSPDQRISWGVAKRDGKFVVVILSEKDNGPGQRIAQDIAESYPSLVETQVVGKAHSVRPADQGRRPLTKPLFPGSSIGHIQGFPGTIGCVVRSRRRNEGWIGVTSASHVLGMTNTAERGDIIIAPGHPDGPKSSVARCGTLERFIYLTHYSKTPAANFLCCADVGLVKIHEDYEGQMPDRTWVVNPETGGQMPLKGVLSHDESFDRSGDTVYKVGRSTDLTKGTLHLVGLQRQSIQLPDGRLYLYTDVMSVDGDSGKSFSEPGDSGALVYTADGYALGFVIGGTEQVSFISPIAQCMKDINAEIVL